MRLAILSDIHGNLVAFDAVLADIQRAGVEQIVCLGDVAFGGPQPRECVRRLQELAGSVVLGNTDEFLFHLPTPDPNSESDRRIMDMLMWAIPQFSRADLDFVKAFQPRVEIPLPNASRLLCYHGSPQSNHELILATTSDDELVKKIGDYRASVMAGGHSHTQMLRRYGQSIILNPGSVGMPMERDAAGKMRRPAFGEYAILLADGENMVVEFHRVPLDVKAIVSAMRASGMPHGERLAEEWDVRS